ncbi:MAG: RHS repeat-associated core domain-containing protein, partial [Clostridia bacterium]
KYDASGLRTQKTVNGVVTDYTLHGKLVTGLKQGANSLHFFYDKDSRPQMVEYTDANGAKTLYYYAHNLQGDILAILDSNGAKVVEYKYDAWGKPVGDVWTLTTAYAMLANLNPFRYRGYVYDTETGLYYLRSRYYDPAWGRFVNADSLAGKVGALLGHDMFTYCKGNPVIASDPNGRDPWWGLLSIAIAQLIIKTRGDKFGEKIMAHYFYGNGKKLTISNDTAWNQYLMDNYNFKSEIDRYARTAISSGTNRIDISGKQISLSIDPNDLGEGGYGTGYQLINGSNVNCGGLCVSGVVTQSDSGQYRVNVHYEFHDYMDSGDYSTDVAAVIGSWALVGGCFFYELEISGDVSYDLIY